jgi:hypothetical protein
MAGLARPTLRCLCEDLALTVPRADTALEEISHPLLAKANERFADDRTPHERIAAIDDEVLFKVKAQRWRGAVWVDTVAGCRRAAGRGITRRFLRLPGTTYTADLLPGRDDDLRWRAETAVRAERRLRAVVHDLIRQSLLDGHEHAAMLDGAALGIQVLADQGHETYVAIRIIGSVPRQLVATILSLIPGCELDAWMSDYAMPERAVAPEEQIWSNIMDPVAAAKFLDQQS